MLCVAAQAFVPGSYSSALVAPLGQSPPATSTLPLGSSVAVRLFRGLAMFGAGDQVLLQMARTARSASPA